MKILKVLNNSAVQALDDNSDEVIIIGKGVGFQKQVGDKVDLAKAEKTFILPEQNYPISNLFEKLSSAEIQVVNKIIAYAEDELGETYSANLFVTLADHIQFAIERYERNEIIGNSLAWNLKRLYKREYRVGQRAVQMIEDDLDMQMDDSEAASIALHLINASKQASDIGETFRITQIIEDILHIVELHFGQKFDEDSIFFSRFVTHLQFFGERVVSNAAYKGKNDDFLFEQVQRSYPEAFKASAKVSDFIQDNIIMRLVKKSKFI
ncbi:PRD domain-containing protein [Aerococcus agrisoli]|uniref:PRD domain-containing protein n=1 Tax=Aerococcus agrisoli TaxID=2487350 RepID=UPI000F50C382|nr:PRD domain-containing protein [Aerococcus agrisoli]